jgi:tetratricopeptide (TPR) repeat protein
LGEDVSVAGLDVAQQVSELVRLGAELFERGRLDDAKEIFLTLDQVSPGNFAVLKSLGVIFATEGAFPQAAAYLRAAVALRDDDALSFNVLSVCEYRLGDDPAALDAAERALALQPQFPEAHSNRGNALNRLGRKDEALGAFDRALALNPNNASTLVNRANALRDLRRPAEALEALDRAIALAPGLPAAHSNRGNVLDSLGRAEEAIDSYDRALALDPRMADAHGNKGNVLASLGRRAEAISSYDAALAIDPRLATLHIHRGVCHHQLGAFEEGWRELEWRWSDRGGPVPSRSFPMPLWLGREDLRGKTILLHAEQGFGDAIQFARYATDVAELGATVLVEVREPLVELFGTVEGVAGVIAWDAPLPAADFHCPLMSLPLAFCNAGRTVDAAAPYLRASDQAARAWGEALARR